MAQLFISHSSHDDAIVQTICATLEAAGFDCWVDHQDLRASDRWLTDIEAHLQAAWAVLVVYSAAARASEWVERETLMALDLHKPIFTLRLDDTPLNLALITRQAIAAQSPDALARLIRALHQQRQQDQAPPAVRGAVLGYIAEHDQAASLMLQELRAWALRYGFLVRYGGKAQPTMNVYVPLPKGQAVLLFSVRGKAANSTVHLALDAWAKHPPYQQAAALHALRSNLAPFFASPVRLRPSAALAQLGASADLLEGFLALMGQIAERLVAEA